jgi:hypothetical protein
MSNPTRPGHYYILHDKKHIGVATLEVGEYGEVRLSARSAMPLPGTTMVKTLRYQCEVERAGAAWADLLASFARAENLSASDLTLAEPWTCPT